MSGSTEGGEWSGIPPIPDKKELLGWWSKVRDPDELPSEWAFRLWKSSALGRTRESIKERIAKLAPVPRAAVAAVLWQRSEDTRQKHNPWDVYTEDEAVALFRDGIDTTRIRELVENRGRLSYPFTDRGPNSAWPLQLFAGQHADKFFKREDADWIAASAFHEYHVNTAFLFAAVRLDPAGARRRLEAGLAKAVDPHQRAELLCGLLKSADPKELLGLVADQFYREKGGRLDPHPRRFQTAFLRQLTGDFNAGASRPVMTALVLDKRFPTIGWNTTRSLALMSKLLLGREADEAKEVLELPRLVRLRRRTAAARRRSSPSPRPCRTPRRCRSPARCRRC